MTSEIDCYKEYDRHELATSYIEEIGSGWNDFNRRDKSTYPTDSGIYMVSYLENDMPREVVKIGFSKFNGRYFELPISKTIGRVIQWSVVPRIIMSNHNK